MYRFIKVASHYGAPQKGTDEGPEAILKALGINDFIEVDVPKDMPLQKSDQYEKARYLPGVKDVCEKLIESVKAVVQGGDIPIVLIGDDSSTIGVGYGLYQSMKEPFGIIYIDAHGDINTPETTISGYLYGQGLAHILGLGHPELLSLNDNKAAVDFKNVVMLGQRSIDPGEKVIISEKQITLFSSLDLIGNPSEISCRIQEKFLANNIKNVYIHIDQDVVDPELSGSTFCSVPGGICEEELFSIIKSVKESFDICCISIGNYFSLIDSKRMTMDIISSSLRVITGSKRL